VSSYDIKVGGNEGACLGFMSSHGLNWSVESAIDTISFGKKKTLDFVCII